MVLVRLQRQYRRWANHCFRVFVKHHYSSWSSFEGNIYKKYSLHLSTVYGIKCLQEISRLLHVLRWFDGLNLTCFGAIYSDFPQNFLNFRSDAANNPFLYWVLFINSEWLKKYDTKFSCLPFFNRFFSKPAAFPCLIVLVLRQGLLPKSILVWCLVGS